MSIYALSRQLSVAGVQTRIVIAAEGKIKVITKIDFPKGLDHLISDFIEGTQLRNRVSISEPSKIKVTNWITKALNNPQYFSRPLQVEGQKWVIRISKFGKTFGDPDAFKKTFEVQLVDKKTRKLIYSREDITSGEVELVEVK